MDLYKAEIDLGYKLSISTNLKSILQPNLLPLQCSTPCYKSRNNLYKPEMCYTLSYQAPQKTLYLQQAQLAYRLSSSRSQLLAAQRLHHSRCSCPSSTKLKHSGTSSSYLSTILKPPRKNCSTHLNSKVFKFPVFPRGPRFSKRGAHRIS